MKKQGLPVKFQAEFKKERKHIHLDITAGDIRASENQKYWSFFFQLFHQEESFSGDKTYKLN